MTNYEDETFLEIAIGNFRDCIRNQVHGVQLYVNEFYNYIPAIYPDLKEKKPVYEQLANFLVCESDNIMKLKGIWYVVDCNNLLLRKYEDLRNELSKQPDEYKYEMSQDAFQFFVGQQKYIDWLGLKSNVYGRKENSVDEMLKLEEYMEYRFSMFETYLFASSGKDFTKEDVMLLLDNAFLQLSMTFVRLKEIAETTQSVYGTAKIMHTAITIMTITCIALTFIKLVK